VVIRNFVMLDFEDL